MNDNRNQLPEVWTPTQCNQLIKGRLRDLTYVQIRGEVSGARASRGHLYFDLKDSGSKIRCTVWRSTLSRLSIRPSDGLEVICEGAIDLWVPGGTYALNVRAVRRSGLGQRHLRLQQLTQQLRSEGALEASRRRALPRFPKVVGLVTAPGSAALRDMLRTIHDRFPVRIVLSPTRVQGAGASEQIAQALQRLDRSGLCDVIIVGRGGGSQEDLWAFNEEPVARAILASQTPIVSAVGHESDTLLSDHVADKRAPTPTAAAELTVPSFDDLMARLRELRRRVVLKTRSRLIAERKQLTAQSHRVLSIEGHVARTRLRADHLYNRLAHAQRQAIRRRLQGLQRYQRALSRLHPVRQLLDKRRRSIEINSRLLAALQAQLRVRSAQSLSAEQALHRAAGTLVIPVRQRLTRLVAKLEALNPSAALARGYSIIRDIDSSRLITDAADLRKGQGLAVTFASGRAVVSVQHVDSTDSIEGR